MPLLIPDETLNAAGLNERQAKAEIACRWFDEGKLAFGHAANLAGMTEIEFENELERQGIPRYRYTEQMLDLDLQTLKKLERL